MREAEAGCHLGGDEAVQWLKTKIELISRVGTGVLLPNLLPSFPGRAAS